MFILRKQVMLTLIAIMLFSAMTGCGKYGKTTEGDSSSSEEQKPALKTLNIWMKDDYNQYPVAKLLEERTGYKVQYDMLPQNNAEEKLNLLMASGEQYDAITTGTGQSFRNLYYQYATNGALLDLSSLIENYAPNVTKSVKATSFEIVNVEGKKYCIPNGGSGKGNVSFNLVVRQDWLDKINMKMPETVEEFITMLRLFKEKDPGGNGQNNVPLSTCWSTDADTMIPNVAGAYGLINGWNDHNEKLIPMVMDPAFKEYIKLLNNLYTQGLLDNEFPTNKSSTLKEKFASGKVGVIPLAWYDMPSVYDALLKNYPDAKPVYMPILKGKDGKSGLPAVTGIDRMTYIPKSAKNPEHAIKWINAKLEPETFKLMCIGEEGKHYTIKDGKYFPILPAFFDERNNANNFATGFDEDAYPKYWEARVRKDPRLFDAWEQVNTRLDDGLRVDDIMGRAPYLPEYSKNGQQLRTLTYDSLIKFVVGQDPLSELDAFVEKWKSIGGDTVYKEVNDWYSKYKK